MSHARATGPSGISDNEPFIYKKGPAFGMPGVLVDGMDVRKVRCKLGNAEVGSSKTPALLALGSDSHAPQLSA